MLDHQMRYILVFLLIKKEEKTFDNKLNKLICVDTYGVRKCNQQF